jgi:hypothetical protein
MAKKATGFWYAFLHPWKSYASGGEVTNFRQRPGDQPLPLGNDGPVIHRLVQDDLEKRLQVGIERYGQPLQAFNGRDSLQDAYEEVLDLAVYLRQRIEEERAARK